MFVNANQTDSDSAEQPIAFHGGEPTFPKEPFTWPPRDEAIREALEEVFSSGDWGRYDGPRLAQLADSIAEMSGTDFAIPCSSGTVAVELALRGLRVGDGDEVILAAYDFAGNFRAIEAVGAQVVLVDIDPKTFCLDADTLKDAIGPSTAAIIVSHLHGGLAEMNRLRDIADKHQIAILEDACQSIGAVADGRPAGGWGDVAAFSFGGSKLLTAGRGGMVVTSRSEVRQRIVIASQQGNNAFPLSELQAAVLLPQLERLEEHNRLRLDRAKQLCESLSDCPLSPVQLSDCGTNQSATFRWGFQLENVSSPREQIAAAMRAEGIALDPGFRGFARRGKSRCRRVGDLPNAMKASMNMMLLHHAILLESPETIELVACGISRVLSALRSAQIDK